MSRRAVAGRHGPAVRSDCRATVIADGAATIVVDSRVEALYGASIRSLARATLAALGVSDLSLTLEDSGALPYVIEARVEAAVRRLRPDITAEAPPPFNPTANRKRSPFRRSRLYLPGDEPRYLINAGLHRPDAVVLDLEDSVPADDKDAALLLVRNALRAVDFGLAERTVRVNSGAAGLREIRTLLHCDVDAFVLPKVEHAATVREAAELLDDSEAARLIPIVESARGVADAHAIASASPRVVALAIGLEDYTADIGAERSTTGRESLWALSQVVNAARAAGVEPLASVYSAIDDEAGLGAWLKDMRGLGFGGAACLHPRQIRTVHAAWAPSEDEVVAARRIVDGWNSARADGRAVVAVDGRMVDAPVVARAVRMLQLVEANE